MIRFRTLPLVALFAVAGLVAALVSVLAPPSADAAARLSVTSELGGVTASTDGPTRFDLQGSGYQVIEGGFGGVYVTFGWVNERTWRPSQGGVTGTDYQYVPDSESKNNQGYMGFVAYPGSSTEGEAHATFSSNGSFRLSLNVPGPRFTAKDRSGKTVTVDCTRVTCGWMTFGAHGVKNANNETFVPVTFEATGGTGGGGNAGGDDNGGGEQSDGGAAAAAPGAQSARGASERPQAGTGQARTREAVQQQSSSGGGGSAAASGDRSSGGAGGDPESAESDGGDTAAASGGGSATGAIEVTVDRASARPGGALAYTAYGFWPGEQATVSLGQGIAAVGPLTTGVDGEIAGVITLPDDIEPGTYEIRAVGAGSGLEGSQRFAISDVSLVSANGGFSESVKWEWVFLSLAALLFIAAIGYVVSRRIMANSGENEDDPEPGDPQDSSGDIAVDEFYGSHSGNLAYSGTPANQYPTQR